MFNECYTIEYIECDSNLLYVFDNVFYTRDSKLNFGCLEHNMCPIKLITQRYKLNNE